MSGTAPATNQGAAAPTKDAKAPGKVAAKPRSAIKWKGYPKSGLIPTFQQATDTFTGPGGGAEKKLGAVKEAVINSRNGYPVHKSCTNPADKNDIISVFIRGEKGSKTCHIYPDGTGTSNAADVRQ